MAVTKEHLEHYAALAGATGSSHSLSELQTLGMGGSGTLAGEDDDERASGGGNGSRVVVKEAGVGDVVARVGDEIAEWFQGRFGEAAQKQGAAVISAAAAPGVEMEDEVQIMSGAVPIVGGTLGLLGAGAGRFISLAAVRAFLLRFGASALKVAIGAAAFKEVMDLIGLGAPDFTIVDLEKFKKKRKRYTIGHNPRVRTLQKVARHTMKMLKRHDKYIREFLPKRQPRYGVPPAKLLSAAEKRLIRESA